MIKIIADHESKLGVIKLHKLDHCIVFCSLSSCQSSNNKTHQTVHNQYFHCSINLCSLIT